MFSVRTWIGFVTLSCSLDSKKKRKATKTRMLKKSKIIWNHIRSSSMKPFRFSPITGLSGNFSIRRNSREDSSDLSLPRERAKAKAEEIREEKAKEKEKGKVRRKANEQPSNDAPRSSARVAL